MDCVALTSRVGYIILFFLGLVGLGGVGLNRWWSSDLKFFDFSRADSTNKRNLKRLLLPSLIAALISMFIPIIAIISSSEFRNCLEDPDLGNFLPNILTFFLPVVGTGIYVSVFVCAFTGFIAYWVFGLIFYLIQKLVRY